jgi:uncharacterized protein (TIGR03435 family)
MNRIAVVLGAVCVGAATLAAHQTTPAFEVASIRRNTTSDGIPSSPAVPDGISLVNRPLASLVRSAYDLPSFRIVGVPPWANEERFDIIAKAARPITDAERRLMLRALLIERFALTAHIEMREQTVYVMTRVRPDGAPGPGLKPRPECSKAETPCRGGGTASPSAGRLSHSATTIDQLASGLVSAVLESTVVNESELDGHFDVELSWRPDNVSGDANDRRPSFFTAIEEQLGMKLIAQRRPVEVLVIDRIERPTPN